MKKIAPFPAPLRHPAIPVRRRFLKTLAALGLAGWGGGSGWGGAGVARAADRLAEIIANIAPDDLRQHLVSEKMDGVRARWDGKQLLSRNGNTFAALEWFFANFPSHPLDGELWMRRGQFEAVSGAVRRKNPPPLGAIITYRHQGLAGDGNPRFPVFPRVRDDEPRDD